MAADAQAAIRWLRTQKEVDPMRIGLVGGSQAGWIMPLAASNLAVVRFMVIFAGTPVSAGEEAYHGRLTGDGGGNGLPIAEADRWRSMLVQKVLIQNQYCLEPRRKCCGFLGPGTSLSLPNHLLQN